MDRCPHCDSDMMDAFVLSKQNIKIIDFQCGRRISLDTKTNSILEDDDCYAAMCYKRQRDACIESIEYASDLVWSILEQYWDEVEDITEIHELKAHLIGTLMMFDSPKEEDDEDA